MDLEDAWIGTWGLSYIACSIIKPDIFADINPALGRLGMLGFGAAILAGLASKDRTIGRMLLAGAGVAETFGGVASWAGLTKWNVPFQDKGMFNISMALLDLASAAILFHKATSKQ